MVNMTPRNHIQIPQLNLYAKIRSELIFNSFYQLFDVVHADTPDLLEEAHRLRYQVFCMEQTGYEDPSQHPSGMETDKYDDYAGHALLMYKPMNKAIGTVRVIYPNPRDLEHSFPLQALSSAAVLHDESYIKNGCELSRLCVSRKYRAEMKEDIAQRVHTAVKHFHFADPIMARIATAVAPLGLIRGTFEMALKKNLLNCYGVMEPFHLSKLIKAGLCHKVLGPNIDFHGQRTPFMCNILEVFDHAVAFNPDSWNIVSMRGFNHKLAEQIQRSKELLQTLN